MHAYCGDSPFMAVFGCQRQVVWTCHGLTEYRGVHCVAEIRNKIKETCSIHEIRNLLQTIQCTERRNRQTTAMVNCPLFQQFFGNLPPQMKITTIIVINIIWRFYYICLRSCSINHSILIKGTRITPARRHRFFLL